jgi:glycosyltransferase involved in cell wall biosynthesis
VPVSLTSVVLPVYNGEATLRRALESVFAQDSLDLEVVVCNDGSTDATGQILSEYSSRVVVVTQENRGRGTARNACLGRARADLIALLDADDWWRAGKLAGQLADAARLPETGVFYGNAYVVNGSGQIYRSMNGEWHVGHSGWVFPFLVRQNFVPMPTVLVRRSAIDQAGGFDETLKRSQGLEWLLRLSTITPFHYSPAMLAFCDDRNWGSAEKRIDTCAYHDGYLYQKFPECLNNLAVACARVGDAGRARELLEQAVVEQAFYSDAIGNLQALESDADPATLRATSRRVFQ